MANRLIPLILYFYLAVISMASAYAMPKIAPTCSLDKKAWPVLRIAVAANFFPTLTKIIPPIEESQCIKVQIISGSSGTLFQQIIHGAPFDLFLSADSLRPQLLIEKNVALKSSLHTYAIGTIAFWSASWQPKALLPDFEQIISTMTNSTQRIAIANPDIAPYGVAAKEMLGKNNLWQIVAQRLITGVNINQTFQQVRSQGVQLGVVAKSQLVQNQLVGVDIPTEQYQAIRQQLVILSRSKYPNEAQKIIDFLLTKSTQQTLSQFGYQIVSEVYNRQ